MSYKSFSGRTNAPIKQDPVSGGYSGRTDFASVARACDRFLREREPGYAKAQDTIAAAREANKAARKTPHARG